MFHIQELISDDDYTTLKNDLEQRGNFGKSFYYLKLQHMITGDTDIIDT
uniref:Uncharacterized protein n=1 Tax=Romanomermis culicivorax TaxID=13658 RepID=A0A915KZ13_ROMCU